MFIFQYVVNHFFNMLLYVKIVHYELHKRLKLLKLSRLI